MNILAPLDFNSLMIAIIIIFCVSGIIILLLKIIAIIIETAAIRNDAAALITGIFKPLENKKHLIKIKRKGSGLRAKLTLYTEALILIVVIMVSFPFYRMTTDTQKETLLKSLWDRSTVLLEALSDNSRRYLYYGNMHELASLPAQMFPIREALYVTITGHNPESSVFEELVWATNDSNILEKIDTDVFLPGISRLIGSASSHTLNLNEPSGINIDIWSEPPDFLNNFQITPERSYLFFKPIFFHLGSDDPFFRGLVRLEVSIDLLLDDLYTERHNLIIIIIMIGLLAQFIGFLGSLVLSGLLIRPIYQLVKHVEIIRDTEDKTRLYGKDIKIKSNDELGFLGDTINEMTHALVKASLADSDLSIGKEVQKKFLPLELDKEGNKLNFGFEETNYLSFYSYYEGAKGVSGDYFDYQDLDGRYYAIIKCDVAGKGIPAAFIMIQVATMFLNYFKHWEPNEEGMRIEKLVYEINSFIETLGFQGRFAAFTLCLYDSHTGELNFCNAGDNIVRIYDSTAGKVRIYTLPQTPAAGALSNSEVESKGGYKIQTIKLNHGDILLLYTDGIEESKRKFRNRDFYEISCIDNYADEKSEDLTQGSLLFEKEYEEIGNTRVMDIINALMNKQTYTLRKNYNPEGDENNPQFDFKLSNGNVEEVILAMISMEKMFRCYKDPNATLDNRILVDKKVDNFLKKHLIQYLNYGLFTQEIAGNESHIYYTHIKEDEQYDDLTILGLSRK